MTCDIYDVVDFVLEACKRATTTGEANEKYSTIRKVFLIQDKKKIVDMFRACPATNTKICKLISEATGESYWTWATRTSNWIMADNKGNLNVEFAVSVQRVQPKPVVPEFKQMTVDVAHRLVAFDCELASLDAQYENYKECAMKELDRQLTAIQTLAREMNALKAEYNVA